MPLLVALLLGAIQGTFMFVPVSSTSHLVLAQTVLRERGVALPSPDSPEMILFDLVVHVGTLVSVVIVMRGWLAEVGRGVRAEWRGGRPGATQAPNTRLVALGLLSVAVTGVLGLVFYAPLTSAFGSPRAVAVALLLTGALLWWTDAMIPARSGRRLRFGWRGPAEVTVTVAILIGVAQAAALAPGLSRSGTTIFAALVLGLHRVLAARYSFAIAIPTILAATAVQALQMALDQGVGSIGWGPMVVGFVTAAAVGTVALWLVLRLLEAARFRVFSLYVWALAGAVAFTGVGERLGG
jgi:undecaprenyl-diphosphatase